MQCLPIIRIFPVKITKSDRLIYVDSGFVLEGIEGQTVNIDKIFTIIHLNYLGNCPAARLGTDVGDEVVKHGNEWVVGSGGDSFVELHILGEDTVDIVVVAAQFEGVFGVELLKLFAVFVVEAALTDELGDADVDDLAKVEYVLVRTAAGEDSFVEKWVKDLWGRAVADESTLRAAYFDDAERDEGTDSLADGVAADAEGSHEFNLGGQFVTGFELAGDDGVSYTVYDGLHKRFVFYRGHQMLFVQEKFHLKYRTHFIAKKR